jgi:hypothetical protein
MPWKKNSPDVVQRFDKLVAVKGAERGTLFGCPIYVLAGERYATLYQNQIALRLSPVDAAVLISRGGRAFEPIKGRKSKERVVLPDDISASPRALRAWVRKAVAYARAG